MNGLFKKFWLCMGLMLALTGSISAQTTTGAIGGTITEAKTKEKIDKAKIVLVWTKNETLRYEMKSDDKGRYYKAGLQPGAYRIKVEMEGFLPVAGTVRVPLGDAASFDIALTSLESSIPESVKIARKGMELLESGKYPEAIAEFSKGVEKDSANPLFYFYRGLACERNQDLESAIQDYRQAVELRPDFVLAYSRSGIAYAKLQDYTKASEFYHKAVEMGDKDVTTHYNYGVVLMNQGKSSDAKGIFERLLALDKDYADAHYQLGIIHLGLGDSAQAKMHLERFLDLDPEGKNASIARKILETLK